MEEKTPVLLRKQEVENIVSIEGKIWSWKLLAILLPQDSQASSKNSNSSFL